jgi:hypothetical protein
VSFRRVVTIASSVVFLLVAAGNYITTVHAGEGFQSIAAEELKMTSEPLAPGAAAVILYRQVDRDDNLLTSHEDNYLRIKILTEEGRKYANVEIPFLKGSYDIAKLRGRTIRPDGTVVEFDGKVFEKELIKSRGMKFLAKTFILPDAQVGSIIEYFYTIDFKERYFFESHWILSEDLFTKKAGFSLKPYSHYNNRMSARWTWQNLPPGTTPPAEGPDHIIRMETNNIPAFQTEDHMPPENEVKARVDFVYEDLLLDRTADQYWKRVGKTRNSQLEGFVGKRKAMEEAVAQIVSPNDPPEVKLRKIYDRVQHLRNTSYELRKTQQEEKRDKGKVDENVEDVWKRGYGNGVQLTWLYLALVRAAGFDASGVWVSDRRHYFFNAGLMQASKLNANVVQVKLNGKDLYFDPGADFTPFGLLTWSETGVKGLRLDKDGGTWIKTTLPASSESRIQHSGKLKLSDAGDLEGKITVQYTGLEAMYHRLNVVHADDVTRKKFLEDRLKTQIPAAAEVELTNKPDWEGTETPLIGEFDVRIPGWASNAGKRFLIPAGVFTASEKLIFEHANRVHPIYFEYPYEKVDDITIELPPGWQVGSVPPAEDQDKGLVGYSLKVENGKNVLQLTRKLKVDFLILEQKYYPALRLFFQAVRTADEQQIVLQPGTATASN